MRAGRLVSLLLLLQVRRRATAQELAETLGVSERTIYRDVQALSEAGVPVYGEAGHDGGFRLIDGYRTELTGLTRQEAEALFLTGFPDAANALGFGAAVSAAQLKLLAALPKNLREEADRLRGRFHLDAQGWYADSDHTPFLSTVVDAVFSQRRVRFRYRRWEEPREVTRTVAPYGVVLKGGSWYVIGARSGGLRTYRVSRISACRILDETFTRPEDFDLVGQWRRYLVDFDARRQHGTATLRISPRGMDVMPFLLEPAAVRAAEATAESLADGWSRIVIPIEDDDQALLDLLRLGPDAEVLEPSSLRAAMAATAAAISAHYVTETAPAIRPRGVRQSPRRTEQSPAPPR